MSVIELDKLKSWARIEHAEDDESLQLALDAAEEWVGAKLGRVWDELAANSRETLIILALAAHWAENLREAAGPVKLEDIPRGVKDLIDNLLSEA
jgi:hypothetical protein